LRMSYRQRVGSALDSVAVRMYPEPVRSAFKRLGLHDTIRHGYVRLAVSLTSPSKSPPRVVSRSIAGKNSNFWITTPEEYFRVNQFHGEEQILRDLMDEVRPSDVFFDVGANIGTYTCPLAEIADRVVSFEPHPVNAKRLRENVRLNDYEVIVVEAALSDSEGKIALATEENAIGSGEHAITFKEGQESIIVHSMTGDQLVSNGRIPCPSVVKVDVEGAEVSVLSGLRQSIALDRCRIVYVEVHSEKLRNYGHRPQDVTDILQSSGFCVETIHSRGSEYFLKAVK